MMTGRLEPLPIEVVADGAGVIGFARHEDPEFWYLIHVVVGQARASGKVRRAPLAVKIPKIPCPMRHELQRSARKGCRRLAGLAQTVAAETEERPFSCLREARHAYGNRYTQFSTRTPGMRMNSFMLFVTTTSPSLRACAPICMSCGPQGVPARSSSARTCP